MIELILNVKPFSINSAYFRRGGKTAACRAWFSEVFDGLKPYSIILSEFRESFNPKTHGISISLHWDLPNFLTKKGVLSKTAMDLSNIEKLLIDAIFDERYFERGVENLNINDAFIIDLHSYKRFGSEYKVTVKIDTVLLP